MSKIKFVSMVILSAVITIITIMVGYGLFFSAVVGTSPVEAMNVGTTHKQDTSYEPYHCDPLRVERYGQTICYILVCQKGVAMECR